MRAAFIGSHGVGKTTIAKPVARRAGLPHITEQARIVARENGWTPATVPSGMLDYYQWQILKRQIDAENRLDPNGFLSDRSVIDNMAYYYAHLKSRGMGVSPIRTYAEMALERLNRYDCLIYVPITFPLPSDDPERHPDHAFQLEVDETILQLIDLVDFWYGVKLPVKTLESASKEERIYEALTYLLTPVTSLDVIS